MQSCLGHFCLPHRSIVSLHRDEISSLNIRFKNTHMEAPDSSISRMFLYDCSPIQNQMLLPLTCQFSGCLSNRAVRSIEGIPSLSTTMMSGLTGFLWDVGNSVSAYNIIRRAPDEQQRRGLTSWISMSPSSSSSLDSSVVSGVHGTSSGKSS